MRHFNGALEKKSRHIHDIVVVTKVLGHLGTEHMRHLGTQYWTSLYSVLEILVQNNKNNLIEFKNFL